MPRQAAARPVKFDAIDRAILREVQGNARITNSMLAERVGISPPSTLERVKKLESQGVIKGYAALLDPVRLNQSIAAIVHISIKEHSAAVLEEARRQLTALDEVQSCWYCAGDEDFILKVRVEDMAHYEQFVSRKLAAVPGIGKLRTSFVLSEVKDSPCVSLESMRLK
ncbi:MAG: Lrp/AsnC family transcriptional regulator [Phycisphaerales bacterium]|nr:Lrp/AsnC family transcriptional regulator [Phycisphaerales bacterium]